MIERYCTKCDLIVSYDSTEHLWGCECFAVRTIEEDEMIVFEFIPDFWVDNEDRMDKFTEEMLTVITKFFPFTLPEVKAIYDRRYSLHEAGNFDYVVELCNYAATYNYSDLEEAEREKYG